MKKIVLILLLLGLFIGAYLKKDVLLFSKDKYYYPVSTVSKLAITNLLINRDFTKLNDRLNAIEEEFAKDYRKELFVYDAYYPFEYLADEITSAIDEWLEHSPDKHYPYLAKALNLSAKGWASRGTAWASETSEEQFMGMRKYLAESVSYVDKALEMKRDILLAYDLLMAINTAGTEEREVKGLMDQALSYFPKSFILHKRYMWSILPRWGGSYDEMREFINSFSKEAKANKMLNALKGYIFKDYATLAMYKKNYKKALVNIDKALDYGLMPRYLETKAEILLRDERYDEALAVINKAIAIRPENEDYYLLRARIKLNREEFDSFFEDIEFIQKNNQYNSKIEDDLKRAAQTLVIKAWDLFQKKKINESLDLYNLAHKVSAINPDVYLYRAYIYLKKGDLNTALKDLKEAFRLNKKNIDIVKNIDYILARSRKWKEILPYWDEYIENNPRDAEAYYERSGTHHHNQDKESSLKDLKKAAELGHKDAKKRYERMIR